MLNDNAQATPGPARRFSSPPRWARWAGLVLSLVLAAAYLLKGGTHLRYFLDLEVYRAGAQAFLHGEAIYERDYDMGIITLPFTYPPLAALLFAPLAWLPSAPAAIAFLLLNVTCAWWVMVLVLRRCAPHASAEGWAACLLPLALLFEPVRETIFFGQINLILMALVCTDVLGRPRVLPRGALVGLAAAIKLTPAVFGLYFLLNRDWKAAAWATGSGLGYTLLAAAISPGNSATYWLDTLANTGRIGNPSYVSNQSLQGLFYRLALEPPALTALWLAASLLFVALIAWAMRRLLLAHAAPAALVANSLIALLCSPISWTHHWVWLVPACLVAASAAVQTAHTAQAAHGAGHARRSRGGRAVGALSAAIAAAALLSPHWLLPNDQGRELDWPLWALPLGNAYLLLGAAFLACALATPRSFATPRTQTAPRPAAT